MNGDDRAVAVMEVLLARLDQVLAQPPVPSAPEFYSIKGAAAVVGVSVDHIRRAVVAGSLACSNVGTMGRPTYRIARADLLAWVERQKAGPLPARRGRGRPVPVSRHHQRHSDAPGS